MDLCEHLKPVDDYIKGRQVVVVHQGVLWSKACRYWKHYDCIISVNSLRKKLNVSDCVLVHSNLGNHEGSEFGFYCSICHDGLVGHHPKKSKSVIVIK